LKFIVTAHFRAPGVEIWQDDLYRYRDNRTVSDDLTVARKVRRNYLALAEIPGYSRAENTLTQCRWPGNQRRIHEFAAIFRRGCVDGSKGVGKNRSSVFATDPKGERMNPLYLVILGWVLFSIIFLLSGLTKFTGWADNAQ
jgi:hypothetical protein